MSTTLDRSLRAFLIGGAVIVFVVAVLIIVTMEPSSASQGGRLYVAIAAIAVLGGIDRSYGWLADRRRPLWMEGPGEAVYRRYLWSSLGLLVLAAVSLIGLALVLS